VALADMNEAVLQAIEEHALTPEAIEQVIQLSERDDVADQRSALDRERKDVGGRLLGQVVEKGWRARAGLNLITVSGTVRAGRAA
jgi:hypothetical protein